jgi:UDP-N-acetylmuramoylalanine--D-glutamate ligase
MNPNDPSTVPGTPGVPEATPTEAGLGVGAPGSASAGSTTDGVAPPELSTAPAAEADVDASADTDMGQPEEAALELKPSSDTEAPSPATEAPAATAPAPSTAWNPEAVPAVSAAKAAADFVAQIFAEVAAPEGPAVAEPDAAQDADVGEEAAPAAPLVSPVEAMAQLLQGQNILILGLGASGMAMARWCVRCGAQVTVADTRTAPPQLPALQQTRPPGPPSPRAATVFLPCVVCRFSCTPP